jgi:hypothetical protein
MESSVNLGSDDADSIAELRNAFANADDNGADEKLTEIQNAGLRVELFHVRELEEKFLGQIGVADDVLLNLPACALRLDMGLRPKPGGEPQEHVQGQMVVKLHKMTTLRVRLDCLRAV